MSNKYKKAAGIRVESEEQSKGIEPRARKCILSKARCKSAKIAPTLQPGAVFDASAWPLLGRWPGEQRAALPCVITSRVTVIIRGIVSINSKFGF